MRYCFTTLLVGATVFVAITASSLLAVEETGQIVGRKVTRMKPSSNEVKAMEEAERKDGGDEMKLD
jgi:hypothetical protein